MIEIRCKKHPKYRGLRVPRVLCNACWYVFHVRTHIMQSSDKRLEVKG